MRTVTLIAFAALVLGGCSALTQQQAFDTVLRQTGEPIAWIKTQEERERTEAMVRTLVSSDLGEEDAVRIALINNRSLQQTYAEVGIAHAELVQAGLISNPLLGYSLGRGGSVTTSKVSVEFAFLELLWMPLRRELGGIALEETQLRVGDAVLRTVRDVRKSYTALRVAEETLALHKQLLASSEAAYQLSIRQYTAGNLPKRSMLKIENAYREVRLESLRIGRDYAAAREGFNRLLGLYGEDTRYRLAAKTMELGDDIGGMERFEQLAIEKRLDIAAAKKRVDYAAKEAGYTQTTRLLSELSLMGEREKTTGDIRFDTVGFRLPVPLFDTGQGRIALAKARYNQSAHALYARAVDARSEAREAYAAARYAYDAAREYRDAIVSANEAILRETQLHYNGMLDGIYELLEDQRHVVEAKMAALTAVGEYRKAHADLRYVIGSDIPNPKEQP